MSKYQKLIDEAYRLGALNVKEFVIEDIVFDPRTILKCKYGCADYGKSYHCPSDSKNLDIEESIRIFKHYHAGLIIHSNSKNLNQEISYELEKLAFLEGYYMALSLSDCGLCKECLCRYQKPCPHPEKARPAFHAVGIDVFKTVTQLKLPIYVLHEKSEIQNWYAAIFIE